MKYIVSNHSFPHLRLVIEKQIKDMESAMNEMDETRILWLEQNVQKLENILYKLDTNPLMLSGVEFSEDEMYVINLDLSKE